MFVELFFPFLYFFVGFDLFSGAKGWWWDGWDWVWSCGRLGHMGLVLLPLFRFISFPFDSLIIDIYLPFSHIVRFGKKKKIRRMNKRKIIKKYFLCFRCREKQIFGRGSRKWRSRTASQLLPDTDLAITIGSMSILPATPSPIAHQPSPLLLASSTTRLPTHLAVVRP
ncbi:hypothetical protein ASPBRDRAFT_387723 [Aspergillus brasiliensis CBS 101740]|uniref:Uncharacterized protein n=1 Tax=Aspergillus brasiliensis (strain CBS 101740 / IMI 381727 / IBT 21946) TaxID=767769 RepID=A0A1L9UW72_ASPBC|nr:hypothetical protein ASPBRDRAFT_387723 [Aspergillus brasiliensis CBS 101740]